MLKKKAIVEYYTHTLAHTHACTHTYVHQILCTIIAYIRNRKNIKLQFNKERKTKNEIRVELKFELKVKFYFNRKNR